MGYNKITLYGKQICDYLYIQNKEVDPSRFSYVDSEPEGWQDNTSLFARFDGNLVAGDSSLTESIVGYEVRRKRGIDAHTEYVGTIGAAKDSKDVTKFMIDYMIANNNDYTYYLYPATSNDKKEIALPPSITDEVKADWGYWSLMIVDETDEENVFYLNKLFKFELNIATEDMTNNAVISVIQNFTKYPTIQYGMSNYWSGGLSALCGFISCPYDEYVQTPNMIEELKQLTSDTRRKFLKDLDGNVWEVKITSPIVVTNDDTTVQNIKSVKVGWTEVGDAKGISVINDPSKPTTNWILTETGEVVPYIEYIWGEQYKWDNSYMWTAKDDALAESEANMGRDLYNKGGD